MIYKSYSSTPGYVHVTFELPACLWADTVVVVGDFNQWNPCAGLLQQERTGIWRTVVELPIMRRFEFRYLIDGRWSTDFHADGTRSAPNGALNSVVDTEIPLPFYRPSARHCLIREAARDAGIDFPRKSHRLPV